MWLTSRLRGVVVENGRSSKYIFKTHSFKFNKVTVETKNIIKFLYLRVTLSAFETCLARKTPWLCIIIVSSMHLEKHFKCFHHGQIFFLISTQSPQELEIINYVMVCFAFRKITCVANIIFSVFFPYEAISHDKEFLKECQLAESVPYKALGQQFYCMAHHGTNQFHPRTIAASLTGIGRCRIILFISISYTIHGQFLIVPTFSYCQT